jgi:hypothetical protein
MDKNKLILGGYFGNETIDDEFKVHCLNSLSKFFDHNFIVELYENSEQKIDKKLFNKMIRFDISNNIIEYLPRYIGSFSASNISGKLHFGISDEGIIEGIPYFGHKLTKTFINKTINKCFDNYLKPKNNDQKSLLWFRENISYKIEKLEINKLLLDDFYTERLEQLKSYVENINKEYEIFRQKFQNWYNMLMKHCVKLKILINDLNVRKEIVQFILNYGLNDNNVSIKAIEFYNSDHLVNYEITKEMLKDKSDDNPIKWLILYKDHVAEIIKLQKPKHPIFRCNKLNYYDFAKHMSNIRNILLSKKCEFYKITFFIPQNPNNYILEYKDKYNKWHCKKRVIDKYGPITSDSYE